MSTERADRLHQQASEFYLQGDYAQAIAAWRELLSLDPGNEQALEGVRMSTLLSEGEDAAAEAPAAPDSDIDLGLKVFDAIPKPAAPAPAKSPNDTMILDRAAVEGMLREGGREGTDAPAATPEIPGFDFGELSDLASIPLGSPAGVEAPPAESTDVPEGEPDAEAFGLAPVVEERRARPEPSAAAAELVRRVRDLLDEAKAKSDAGEIAEAKGLLARVFILDEENAAARQLEAQLELMAAPSLAQLENHLIEGVQAFDQGRHEEAKVHFRAVLDAHPDHREAIHYLEKIQQQEASFGDIPEDLLSPQGGALSEAPAEIPAAVAPVSVEPRPSRPAPRPEAAVAPAVAAMPRASRRGIPLSPKILLGVFAVAALGASAWFVARWMSSGGGATEAAPSVAAAPRPKRANPAPGAAAPAAAAPAPSAAATMTLDEAMAKGRGALAAGEYGTAVIAFKTALDLDRSNVEALDGIRRAGDAYKAQKAEQEQFDRVAMAFREGEYASGLRLLYRLPGDVDRNRVERYKADGWFNLGVVALRAGDVSAAIGHFEDALAILPDPDATKWRSFAQRYRTLPKDRGYYDAVESIPFRQIQ